MSRFEEIEAFVRTVEAGSFTHAARQLRIAKSAISRRVSDLETRLGVQLLQRTTRALKLTDAGRELFETSVRLLADWDEAEGAVSDSKKALHGRLRIAAPLSFGVTYLGPAIIDFLRDHADIEFDIDFSDRRVDLITEGVDVAIRIGDLSDSSMIARKIADIQMVATASPNYLKINGTPQTPDELRTHKELRFGHRDHGRWRYQAPDGSTGEIEMSPRLCATNGEFLRDAALAGEGILIEPSFIICNEIRSGQLVQILTEYTFETLAVYAIYPPTRHLSARVRAFVDSLVVRFSGRPPWQLS